MRIFPPELEERAFRHDRLNLWRDARLVTADAAAKIAAALGEPPVRAAWPLRVLLFGFAALCLAATVPLVLMNLRDRFGGEVACCLMAAAAVGLAETMIREMKVLRHGAEEALICGAVLLVGIGATSGLPEELRRFWALVFTTALSAAAALAYVRYGYRLALIGTAVSLGSLFGSLDLGEQGTRVALAALYASLLAVISFWPDIPRRERERLEIARFFLALSVPLCLNLALDRMVVGFTLHPLDPITMDAFAWATFVAIFAIPAGWLAWGIATRARALLWAGALDLLIAFCSIKPYFGWTRHAWDPAVLGFELVVFALILKRWLDSGPERRRGGFSSEDLGRSEPGIALTFLAGTIAAGPAAAPTGGPAPMKGHGGDFGGGGASGTF